MDTRKEHKKKSIFSFFCKKEKRDGKKNHLKKLFSGREFLLAACPTRQMFYPSYFILFYFTFF